MIACQRFWVLGVNNVMSFLSHFLTFSQLLLKLNCSYFKGHMDVDKSFNTFALPIKWRRIFILVTLQLFFVAFMVTENGKVASPQATEDVLSGTNVRYFGVGANKTGTTSLARALEELGFRVAPQWDYEILLPHWIKRNFQVIIDHVRQDKSNVFQDVPFSHDYTYQALDLAFPESKFILTERSRSDVWFESLRSFHGKVFNGTKMMTANNRTTWNTPTISDLQQANLTFPGFIYSWVKSVFDLPDNDEDASKLLYDKNHFIGYYERHNFAVKYYFSSRPDDLLVLNVEDDDAMERLCSFVGKPCPGRRFPDMHPF